MSRKTRKLIWSAPLVAVLAVAGALAIFAATAPEQAQATHEELPGAVRNLTIMPDGHHEIKLSWDPPDSGDPPDGYRIDRSKDNGTWFTHETMHTGTSYTDKDLDAGSTWFYRVFAYNTAGVGPVSEDRTATTDAATNPGRVRNLQAATTGQNSIMLTWQVPESNGGAPIKHYEIHFAPNLDGSAVSTFPAATVLASTATDDTVIATDGPVLTFSHGMLTAETRYRYIVYAVNDEDLKGTMPSALKAATTDDLTAPGRPTTLTAVQSGADTVDLYWYAPTDNGGTPVTGYDTEVQLGCAGAWTDVTTEWTNAAATANDASWTIPTDDTRPTAACFRVRAHNSADTVTDEADQRFGPYSSSVRLSPVYADAAARTPVVPPVVANGAATYTTDKARVTWEAVDLTSLTANRVSGYRVDVSEDGISWESIRGGSNTNRADDEGDPFFEYAYDGGEPRRYRIFAQVAQTRGPAAITKPSTAEVENITLPGQVRNLNVAAVGPTQIDVRWTAPANDGGAPIDHYIVQATMMGATEFEAWPAALDTANTDTAVNLESGTTSYSHTDLKAGQTWRYRVFAVTEDAAETTRNIDIATNGDEAEVDQATTHQEAMPGKPEHVVAEMAATSNSEVAGSTGILLLWNAPQDPAGADIAGYQVQRKSNDGPWTTLTDSPHTSSLVTDYTDTEGLDEGEMRAYQVRAVSENGVEGAWSDTAYHPQPGTHGPPPMLVAPMLTATPGTGSVTLMWDEQEAAVKYTVWGVRSDGSPAREGNSQVILQVNDITDTSYELTGLTSGEEYWFVVTACAMADCNPGLEVEGSSIFSNLAIATPD